MDKINIGVIGCGDVLAQYMDRAAIHPEFRVVALADLNKELANAQAEKYSVPKVLDTDSLIADPDVQLVVNFTPPRVHAAVTLQAIEAGKDVFTEKPFATTLADADKIVQAATAANVSVSCAPASFLGGGMQTTRKMIDDGWIGRPVAAFGCFAWRGYEHWHPRIDPFYAPGGGPVMDIAPYMVTNMVNLLGPVRRVSASAQKFSDTRPRPGTFPGDGDIKVAVPTHISASLDFESGAVGTLILSWDVWSSHLPYFEIYGTGGSISTNNPDFYGGNPKLRRGEAKDLSFEPYPPGGGEWLEVPSTHRGDAGRAIGWAEMADALRTGRKARTDMSFAYHCLEVMLAVEESSVQGRHIDIVSTCHRPAPLPVVGPDQPFRFD